MKRASAAAASNDICNVSDELAANLAVLKGC
jgi:hypothetical protein